MLVKLYCLAFLCTGLCDFNVSHQIVILPILVDCTFNKTIAFKNVGACDDIIIIKQGYKRL